MFCSFDVYIEANRIERGIIGSKTWEAKQGQKIVLKLVESLDHRGHVAALDNLLLALSS
jgi:dihydroneopterin aldolase